MTIIDPINKIVDVLKTDGVILYPTDTIWGLGASIYSKTATDKIYEIKKRDRSKPILILVDSIRMLKQYVNIIHPRIETLLAYHRQPLTIIYRASKGVPDHMLCGGDSIAIRVVQDEFCKSIINLLGHPISSTSANIASETSPSFYHEIKAEVVRGCDYVVKYRQEDISRVRASVIAKFDENGNLHFLRI